MQFVAIPFTSEVGSAATERFCMCLINIIRQDRFATELFKGVCEKMILT